jgi:hypothetical protein
LTCGSMGETERHLLGALCGLVEWLERNLSEICRHTKDRTEDIKMVYTDMKRVQALLLELEQVSCCAFISLNIHWLITTSHADSSVFDYRRVISERVFGR